MQSLELGSDYSQRILFSYFSARDNPWQRVIEVGESHFQTIFANLSRIFVRANYLFESEQLSLMQLQKPQMSRVFSFKGNLGALGAHRSDWLKESEE